MSQGRRSAALRERTCRRHAHGALSPQLRALSAREIEILRLVGLGRSNTRIAEELFLTVNTVKWHLKNINSKLGVANGPSRWPSCARPGCWSDRSGVTGLE